MYHNKLFLVIIFNDSLIIVDKYGCVLCLCAVDIATLNYIFLYLSSSLFIGLWTHKQDISFISIESFFLNLSFSVTTFIH